MIYFMSFIIAFFILSTQTLIFHPKVRENLCDSNYSDYSDFWLKKKGNKKLLILLHGMYSHPNHFQSLAEKVVEQGWNVYAPALPNSASNSTSLLQQGIYQWDESINVAFNKIISSTNDYAEIALGGHSQGGSFALSIAPSLPFLKGLLVVGSPVYLTHSKNRFIQNFGIWISGILHFLPKKGLMLYNSKFKERTLVDNDPSHHEEFIYGLTLHSFGLNLRKTRADLPQIKIPTHLIYARDDGTVDYKNFIYLEKNLSNVEQLTSLSLKTPYEKEPYSKRHKIITYQETKDQVQESILQFLQSI